MNTNLKKVCAFNIGDYVDDIFGNRHLVTFKYDFDLMIELDGNTGELTHESNYKLSKNQKPKNSKKGK